MIHRPFLLTGFSLLVLAAFSISGCAYRLGNVPSSEMQGVKTIYVPVVKNQTFKPELEVMTTNAIIRALDNDGTYTTSRVAQSDATLDVVLTGFERTPIRSSRENYRVTDQYRITLTAKATLVNHRTGQKVFSDVEVSGSTDYFVQGDMQEVERQTIPSAAEKLAQSLVNRVAEGW